MAFSHGKNSRLWVNQRELTSYFQEFGMQAKAGTAETTVFGLGAKTFIGGLQEGTVTAKGYFGAGVLDPQDVLISGQLGAADAVTTGNTVMILSPTGATAPGTRIILTEAAETDYSVSVPVNGVVATSLAANAANGLNTGAMLYDPTTAAVTTAQTITGTAVNDMGFPDTATGATTIAGSFSTAMSTFTGTQTLHVNAIGGFTSSGYVAVNCGPSGSTSNWAILSYNGTASQQLLNCNLVQGTGTWTTPASSSAVRQPFSTNTGGLVVANVLTVGTAEATALQLLSSDDGVSWAQVGTTSTLWSNGTGIGGYYFAIPTGIPIWRFVAAQVTITGATPSFTAAIGFSRLG